MNKDCSKVSIERGSDGRFTVLLTGSKDDIRMLWTKLSVSVSKAQSVLPQARLLKI